MAAVQDLGAYQGDAILVGALVDNADLQTITDLADQADDAHRRGDNAGENGAPAVDGDTVLVWPAKRCDTPPDPRPAKKTDDEVANCPPRLPRTYQPYQPPRLDALSTDSRASDSDSDGPIADFDGL